MALACNYANLSVHNGSRSGANFDGGAAIRIAVTSYCYSCFGGKSDGQAHDFLSIRTVGVAQLAPVRHSSCSGLGNRRRGLQRYGAHSVHSGLEEVLHLS